VAKGFDGLHAVDRALNGDNTFELLKRREREQYPHWKQKVAGGMLKKRRNRRAVPEKNKRRVAY